MSEDNPRALQEFLQTIKEFNEVRSKNKIEDYSPYPKQMLFHSQGKEWDERLLSAGNQLGKTWAGAHEAAYHATGLYPDWWTGHVWDRPTKGWVGGESSIVVRDTSQKLLVGDVTAGEENIGTGVIPADRILKYTWSRGVPQAIDTLTVQHITGGKSIIKFKSYEQQRVKWQGDTIDWVWFDEEPPNDLYSEGLARFTATHGKSWITFTPLKGMSTVVKRFKNEQNALRGEVIMTAHDAGHITDDMLKAMLSKYPEHEHETRISGVPMQGEGRIFQYADSVVAVEPFKIPDYWAHIIGLDLGHGDHPTAAVWFAIDRDTDTIYLYKTYRMKGGNIPLHAAALRAMGRIPIAWPHDANNKDDLEGKKLAEHYRNNSCLMLSSHAQFKDGSMSVWSGIVELQRRIEEGRFKVFSNCHEWFDEFRNYHMEDGKIVKIDDDLLSATRYALMMMSQAKTIDKSWYPGRGPVASKTIAPGTDFDVFGG